MTVEMILTDAREYMEKNGGTLREAIDKVHLWMWVQAATIPEEIALHDVFVEAHRVADSL